MNDCIEFLPNFITELCKLEALILGYCSELKRFPGDVKNWVSLRHLDLTMNTKIEFLPSLNNLETLLLCNCTIFQNISERY